MDSASGFGPDGCRFESCRGRLSVPDLGRGGMHTGGGMVEQSMGGQGRIMGHAWYVASTLCLLQTVLGVTLHAASMLTLL